jgi:hypothetical protein
VHPPTVRQLTRIGRWIVGQLDTTSKRISNSTGVTLTARDEPEEQGHQHSDGCDEKKIVALEHGVDSEVEIGLSTEKVRPAKRPECVYEDATSLQGTIGSAPSCAHKPVSATIRPEPTACWNAR